MQNINVIQEPKAQLISNKKKLKTKSQQTDEDKKYSFVPECTWDRRNREQRKKLVDKWEKENEGIRKEKKQRK